MDETLIRRVIKYYRRKEKRQRENDFNCRVGFVVFPIKEETAEYSLKAPSGKLLTRILISVRSCVSVCVALVCNGCSMVYEKRNNQ